MQSTPYPQNSIEYNYCPCVTLVQPVVITCPDVDCPTGTEAMMETSPTECCPNVTCVPITRCEVDGVMYDVGDSVPSDDPCMVAW